MDQFIRPPMPAQAGDDQYHVGHVLYNVRNRCPRGPNRRRIWRKGQTLVLGQKVKEPLGIAVLIVIIEGVDPYKIKFQFKIRKGVNFEDIERITE